jgi:hypothetical protein
MMVLSWLFNSISRDLCDSIIIYNDTASAMWKDLNERFSSHGNITKIYQLRRAIIQLKQEQLSVSSYFTKLKSLWDELSTYLNTPPCSCGSLKLLV